MRALKAMICLGLMGVLATATCDGDSSDDKRSGQGKGEGPGQEPPKSGGGATGIRLDLIAEGLTSPVALRRRPTTRATVHRRSDRQRPGRDDGRRACRTSRFSTFAIRWSTPIVRRTTNADCWASRFTRSSDANGRSVRFYRRRHGGGLRQHQRGGGVSRRAGHARREGAAGGDSAAGGSSAVRTTTAARSRSGRTDTFTSRSETAEAPTTWGSGTSTIGTRATRAETDRTSAEPARRRLRLDVSTPGTYGFPPTIRSSDAAGVRSRPTVFATRTASRSTSGRRP